MKQTKKERKGNNNTNDQSKWKILRKYKMEIGDGESVKETELGQFSTQHLILP